MLWPGKNQMMNEMNEKMAKIDGQLQAEEDAQISSLEKKLIQRKQRRAKLVDKFGEIQDQK